MKSNTIPPERLCDLCGGKDHKLLFEKEGYAHVRCRGCGLVFVNPIPDNHHALQSNSGTGLMGEDRLTPAQVKRIQKELRKISRFKKNNTLLEIGPGRGWFLVHAKQAGWETWAVEVNNVARSRLTTLGLDKVLDCPAEEMGTPADYFDVVRLWDVIEHLQSPSMVLKAIHKSLRTGGHLRLSTTNFASLSRMINGPDWVYLNGSDHIFLFEPLTISLLLTQIGFVNIRIRTRSFNLRRKRYHPEQDLSPQYHFLLPFRKIIDELIRLTSYGHQMIVTAKKAG